MELESCQNPTHTQNVFYSRTTIHTHTKRVLLTHNDSHTRSVWFANTKHHSQTNAFCFRNKYIMFYIYKATYFFNYKKISSKYKLKSFKYKKKSFKHKKQFYKYGNLKVARGCEGMCYGRPDVDRRGSYVNNVFLPKNAEERLHLLVRPSKRFTRHGN